MPAITWLLAFELLSQANVAQSTGPYTGPSPDAPFWKEIIARGGELPLEPSVAAIRVVWSPEALIYAAVITVERQNDGALVRVRSLPDRRKTGASTTQRRIGMPEWLELRALADTGIWKQQPTAPSDAPPQMTDGVLWYAEMSRGGLVHAISRHAPCDPDVVRMLSRVLALAGMPDRQPKCAQ
jgi:hypothetical protein